MRAEHKHNDLILFDPHKWFRGREMPQDCDDRRSFAGGLAPKRGEIRKWPVGFRFVPAVYLSHD
jgi:hypothetical protein